MRVSLVDLEQRISLNSYRIGAGYFKQFGNQFYRSSNYDKSSEYIANKFQNEADIFLTLQYKF
jgi:hypothetical protein